MQRESLQEAREWLDRAEHDLQTVTLALQASQALPDIAAYHAQQAAEKALKSFLAAHNHPIPQVHALVPLVAACQAIVPDFSRFQGAAQTLTPYAVRFRYPPGPLEPPLSDAREAQELATEIVQFVRQRLFGQGS